MLLYEFFLLALGLYMIISSYFLITQVVYSFRKDRVVFVASKVKYIQEPLEHIIKKYIQDTSKYSLVELGAGTGSVSRILGQEFKWRQIIAVEKQWLLIIMGKIISELRRIDIKFLNRDLLQYEIPKPAFVYLYLFPKLVNRLYSEGKLDNCLVVTLSFGIKDVAPTEIIALREYKKTLYVYDLRRIKQPA